MRCPIRPLTDRQLPNRRGLTLLEVLVSCGILLVGLSGLAALLPGAASRLNQAATEDRAGVLSANVRTEIRSRGLTRIDLFSAPDKGTAIGSDQFLNQLFSFPEINPHLAPPVNINVAARIDSRRGLVTEDQILFDPPSVAVTPTNLFATGIRAFRSEMRWESILMPTRFPTASGDPAVFSVLIFTRSPTASFFNLQQHAGGVFEFPTAQDGRTIDEASRKKFFPACRQVLVVPKPPPAGAAPRPPTEVRPLPAWVRVTTSWTQRVPPVSKSFVVLDFRGLNMADYLWPDSSPTPPPANGSTEAPRFFCKLISFDNLVRVDQYHVVLE